MSLKCFRWNAPRGESFNSPFVAPSELFFKELIHRESCHKLKVSIYFMKKNGFKQRKAKEFYHSGEKKMFRLRKRTPYRSCFIKIPSNSHCLFLVRLPYLRSKCLVTYSMWDELHLSAPCGKFPGPPVRDILTHRRARNYDTFSASFLWGLDKAVERVTGKVISISCFYGKTLNIGCVCFLASIRPFNRQPFWHKKG